jgi:hypothetical protein
MKYLKKYESVNNLDIDFAIVKIKSEYDDDRIKEMLDDEIEEWVEDSDLGDTYETKLEWYWEHNNGEAQEIVVEQIINWYKRTYNKELSSEEESKLGSKIKSTFEYLDY